MVLRDHQWTRGGKYDWGVGAVRTLEVGGSGGSWWIVVVNQLMWSHMITSGLEVGKMIQGEGWGERTLGVEGDLLGGLLFLTS